ncbi:MAG TPA: DUF5615 family PIN-like protein [Jatrophihabitans sp.]|jgi:predicted nuclease of predicted toxin-antitoxin system
MRFLLDHNISPKVADRLRAGGHDVVNAREVNLSRATDEVVIDFARAERRVLVSADTDFGTILARTSASTPSFILIRRMAHQRPTEQARIILDNLPVVADDLDAGAIVVLGDLTLRIRRLPLG